VSSATVEDLGSALRFVAPYRTQWITALYLPLEILVLLLLLALLTWAGWTLVQGLRLYALALLVPVFPLGFGPLAFLLGSRLVELHWQLVGREVLEVDAESVVIRHAILGAGISRRLPAASVGAVSPSRATDPPFLAWHAPGTVLHPRSRGPSAFRSFRRGSVAVETVAGGPTMGGARYGQDGSPTLHFGSSIAPDEAAAIVATIHRRFPAYEPATKPAR
jgi:hypothetical protein